MRESTLIDLVHRAKGGDETALTELLARFRPLIRACCRGLPIRDGQDLEQELCLQLIRLVRTYDCDPGSCILFGQFIENTTGGGGFNGRS